MSFVKDNADYEAWLGKQCDVVVHGKQPSGLLELARSEHRAPDPFLDIYGKFVVRRLAPDSRKIELNEKAATHVEGDTCRPWRSILRRSMLPARPAPQHCGAI